MKFIKWIFKAFLIFLGFVILIAIAGAIFGENKDGKEESATNKTENVSQSTEKKEPTRAEIKETDVKFEYLPYVIYERSKDTKKIGQSYVPSVSVRAFIDKSVTSANQDSLAVTCMSIAKKQSLLAQDARWIFVVLVDQHVHNAYSEQIIARCQYKNNERGTWEVKDLFAANKIPSPDEKKYQAWRASLRHKFLDKDGLISEEKEKELKREISKKMGVPVQKLEGLNGIVFPTEVPGAEKYLKVEAKKSLRDISDALNTPFEAFKEKLNSFTTAYNKKQEDSSLRLKLSKFEKKDGPEATVYTSCDNKFYCVMAVEDKDTKLLKYVTVNGAGDGNQSSGATILLGMTLASGAAIPEVTAFNQTFDLVLNLVKKVSANEKAETSEAKAVFKGYMLNLSRSKKTGYLLSISKSSK